MKPKRKKVNVLTGLLIILGVIICIFFGGYIFLDKVVVPKYLDKYGIYGMGDLVGIVVSLYKNPKESMLVKNGYTQTDLKNAIGTLKDAGYNIDDDGSIDIENFGKSEVEFSLTDKEFAALSNKMLESGILVDVLPNLNYLNLINITVLEVQVTPKESSLDEESNAYNIANVESILKVETTDIKDQIARQMDTPRYLLEMIIPDNMYFTVSFDIDLSNEGEVRSNGKIAINGRTEEQSEILINLLINFIFPKEESMDSQKFIKALGDIITLGINELGSFKFAKNIHGNQNGFLINYGAV